MDRVPLADPAREYRELREELDAALREVLDSGRLILGPAVERFEEEAARRLGVAHAVGLASGTDALRLALEALGIGEGDEVVTSPFAFLSTAASIVQAGARPVFADIRPDTFNLDAAAAEAAVTPRTAALLPVHLFGQMAEVEALEGIARRHGLALVEDAAQAFGAWQVGGPEAERPGVAGVRRAGASGDAGCFSFYPTKNLGGLGDGGMVATDDPSLAERIRSLRVHGRDPAAPHRHPTLGYNSRLDALQAAALRVKLERVEEWNERRRAHAAAYDAVLSRVPDLRPPPVARGNRHVYNQYTVRCGDRRAATERLEAAGIGYGIYYPVPLHLQEAFAFLGGRRGEFPEAEAAAREALSLPVFPGLREEERARVVEALTGL